MADIIKLKPCYDRSRVVTDWKCPRSRYWNYEYNGRGVVTPATSLPLWMGITIHDALAALAILTKEGKDIPVDDLCNGAYKQMFQSLTDGVNAYDVEALQFAQEQSVLVEGMLRGFIKLKWPQLLAQYPRILYTESEMVYEHDGLHFMSKPDLVMANDEETVYVEYKTTSSKKDAWVNSWQTAIQLHSTIKAIETTHGIRCDAVVVQGLYKGYESYGKQSSPFCYAYKRSAHPPFSKEEISYDYKAGYRRTATWDLPGGVKKWVEDMPDVILGDQFPQTAPIYINDEMVELFFKQRAKREREIYDATNAILSSDDEAEVEELLNTHYPQRFDQCIPGFGFPCGYRTLCHGPQGRSPLDMGFVYRQPHHEPEVQLIEARLENL